MSGDVGATEVVAYDSQNFQFIVDGGEVSDTNGRCDHTGGTSSDITMRVDAVPLEVTNEVDIENVGMEYDVISSEGHAAKPRCTASEKMQILQYAIEHSVREASQKYGISPGTLYYWKKTGLAGIQSSGAGSASSSLPSLVDGRPTTMSLYPGNSNLLLEQIQTSTGSGSGGTEHARKAKASSHDESAKVTEQFLSTSKESAGSLAGNDVNFLQAVSSLLNSAENASRESGGGDGGSKGVLESSAELSPRSCGTRRMNSISGGISSPTEVLVAPLQVATEEMAENSTEITSDSVHLSAADSNVGMVQEDSEKTVESVVVVETEHNGSTPSPGVIVTNDVLPTEGWEQEVEQELTQEEGNTEGVAEGVAQDTDVLKPCR